MNQKRRAAAVVCALVLALPAVGAAVDFSAERLRVGEEAFRSGRLPEAVDQLRIACFGLLDQVGSLSECLVFLAVAQDAARQPDDVQATILRFLEVERRFAPYRSASVPPEIRRRFEALLVSRMPGESLQAFPALAPLVETDAQKAAKLPEKERAKALEAAAGQATRALHLDERNLGARVQRARARTALRQYRGALDDLAKLPEDEWRRQPELFADLFVCQVGVRDWEAAEGSGPKIPSALQARPDVASAQGALAAERARRKTP